MFELLTAGIEEVFPGEKASSYYRNDGDSNKAKGLLYNVYMDLREELRALGLLETPRAKDAQVEALKGL